MNIKHTLALLTIVLGIWASLEFQNALAEEYLGQHEVDSLHHPSPGLLAREQRGQVTIYDGLTSTEVDKALDQQFERITNLMFVRTRHVEDDGDVTVDDDCD